ncbi:MAG: PEP-CTERM sorting domain-containing protein [Janthinobacterium lividum]
MISKQVAKAAFIVCSLVGAQAAHATPLDCRAEFTGTSAKVLDAAKSVTAASACQYLAGSAPSNVASITNINAAGFFGYSDWAVNGANGQVNSNGTWKIADADFSSYDYMIVFKSGQGTNLIGFLLNEQFASGSWSTPFTRDQFSLLPGRAPSHGVSHYTIVQRLNPTPTDVPEPGSLVLLGLGAAGLAAARRRAQKR